MTIGWNPFNLIQIMLAEGRAIYIVIHAIVIHAPSSLFILTANMPDLSETYEWKLLFCSQTANLTLASPMTFANPC